MKFIRETAFVKNKLISAKEARSTFVTSFKPFTHDIYKFKRMTPHEEMEDVSRAKDQNTIFESAINTSTDFICGKEFLFKSEDEFSKKLVEKWLLSLDFDFIFRELVAQTIATGNSYLEQDFINPKMTNGVLVPNKFYNITDSSRIYINSDAYGNPLTKKVVTPIGEVNRVTDFSEYFIQKLDESFKYLNQNALSKDFSNLYSSINSLIKQLIPFIFCIQL